MCREVRLPSFGLGIEIARVFIFLAGARAKVASFPVKLPGTLDSRSTCFVMVLLAWFSSTVACRSGSSVHVEERTA
jgi:hypothetical protein